MESSCKGAHTGNASSDVDSKDYWFVLFWNVGAWTEHMISSLLDILRRNADFITNGASREDGSTVDESAWKTEFEALVARSEAKPRILVEFTRLGFPNQLRGWAWCRVLRVNEVPSM